mmetsp:Transcript_53623/g.100514  ORF Transcript_53623/g.100514 Transcript_53623/m.100514 type:complete len:145 (+) Transcript_53623:51-485(+)
MLRRRTFGGCCLAFLLAIGYAQLAFGRPWMSPRSPRSRSQVSRAARTPGGQSTAEPEFPEFAPSGEYMAETPLFKLEKYKKEEGLGLVSVAGALVVLSIVIGIVTLNFRPKVNLLDTPPAEPEPVNTSQPVNKAGKPIRVINLG